MPEPPMLVYLMSLIAMFMPLGTDAAPPEPPTAVQPASRAAAPASLAWLNGTWRTDALEMTCKATAQNAACREEGRSEAMRGAEADLTITPAIDGTGTQLKVALATIPPSIFAEIAREARSVTYQMQTKVGVARLRFTREGDTLKVERGNDKLWGTVMTYRRG
jgi:hypothetical protein